MTYMENVFICLGAPLFLAILCSRRGYRRTLIFLLAGMSACLLSSYISTFISGALGIDATFGSYEVVPIVEEAMKFMPVAFYLMVYEPEKKSAVNGILLVSVGFATFENVCFISSYGTADLLRLVIRGFGTGAMHVMCGVFLAAGLFFLWERAWVRNIGVFALFCFAIRFHAIFNLLVNQSGAYFWIGTAFPLTLVILYLLFVRRRIIILDDNSGES